MNCLKCGREISEDEVFCVECRLDAQRYPVNPAAAVFIPKRSAPEAPKKSPRKRSPSMEEQLNQLRRRYRVVLGLLVAVVLLVAVLAYPAVSYMREDHYAKGQNYRPITPVTTAPTVTSETTE